MPIDFSNLAYLKSGTPRQQLAYWELTDLGIMEALVEYHPLLAGTIPLGIDLPESDLDVICECYDHPRFAESLQEAFGSYPDFEWYTCTIRSRTNTIARFQGQHFQIELFGQGTPSHQQYAYQHMLVEYRILAQQGPEFAQQVIALKATGMKTEPAFAQLLGLEGDPYEALLHYA